jgi:hypothetical protein
MVGTHLLTLGHAVLRPRMVGPNLLPLSAPGLDVHPVPVRLLALGAHLDPLSPLRSLGAKGVLRMLHPRCRKSAASAVTAAAAKCLGALAAASTAMLSLSRTVLAAAVAPGPRAGRGCDR